MKRHVCAAVFAAATIASATTASAQVPERCRVVDPTGTPLNLRSSPGGPVVGTVANGHLVRYIRDQDDARGRTWVLISSWNGGGGGATRGWVFREFIACF
jgi:hypothetical protein